MRQLKITKSITNRESASLDKYLQEIGREELISVEEEVELAGRIRNGDRAALEKLTKSNLRFVVSVAKQYQNQGLSLPDLINEGNLGLIKAAEKFDETRGFKFISYAVWWIRQSILQALAEQSRIVRLPLNQVGSMNKINKAFQRFEQEHERKPSAEELAEMLDIPVDKIAETLKMSGRHVSVDAPFVEGEDNSLIDVMVNEDSPNADKGLIYESLSTEIDRALATLTPREADILRKFFGIKMPEKTLDGENELAAAIDEAFKYDDQILIEKMIHGREIACGVAKVNGKIQPLVVTEIVTKTEFYDYTCKYSDGLHDLITPADFPADVTQRIYDYAVKVYRELNCGGIVRVDFIVTPDGVPYFLEVNTIPGQTAMSIIPSQVETLGLDLTEIYSQLIEDALSK